MGSLTLSRNVRLLLGARIARSLGQGTLVVSFTLCLQALGYGGTAIGSVLMAGLLFGALLTVVVGPLSDRRGSRRLLLTYECAAALAAAAALVSTHAAILLPAATVGGFGRGANGAAGPFAPAEQAWLAREVGGPARRQAFALNAAGGFLGMAVGAVLAALPALSAAGFTGVRAYRWLFAVPLSGSLVAIGLLAATREGRLAGCSAAAAHAAVHSTAPGQRELRELTRRENRHLRRLAATNLLNGLGVGIVGPLIAYWFARRFGRDAGAIGPAIAAGFLLAACGSVLGGQVSLRIGAVRSVLCACAGWCCCWRSRSRAAFRWPRPFTRCAVPSIAARSGPGNGSPSS